MLGRLRVASPGWGRLLWLFRCSRAIHINLKSGEPLDSSIDTMEKVLAILDDAHNRSKKKDATDQQGSHNTEEWYLRLTGAQVFNYKALDVLLQLQLKNDIDIFKDTRVEGTKNTLERLVQVLKELYLRQSSNVNIESIGKQFVTQNPLRILTSLDQKIKYIAQGALRNENERSGGPLAFDLPKLQLYQPFRRDTSDPFALRKGLRFEKHPSNLLAFLINDRNVVTYFRDNLHILRTPTELQNLMLAQSMNGSQAFEIVTRRVLFEAGNLTSFETLGVSGTHSNHSLNRLKAILAHRSKLLKRLDWLSAYKHSVIKLNQGSYDTDEKVINIMAGMFDRFFGAAYKADAKYCQGWVATLVEFYQKNADNEAFISSLSDDALEDFRASFTRHTFNQFASQWKSRRKAFDTGEQFDTDMRQMHSFIGDLKLVISHSK